MEETASAQRREIENNPRQNDTNLISTDIHLDKVQEVHLVWPNLFLTFDCPSSVYTAHDHDLFRTLSR
jgi:hypothetical protein